MLFALWAQNLEAGLEHVNAARVEANVVSIVPDHGMHGGRSMWIVLRENGGGVRRALLKVNKMATIRPEEKR